MNQQDQQLEHFSTIIQPCFGWSRIKQTLRLLAQRLAEREQLISTVSQSSSSCISSTVPVSLLFLVLGGCDGSDCGSRVRVRVVHNPEGGEQLKFLNSGETWAKTQLCVFPKTLVLSWNTVLNGPPPLPPPLAPPSLSRQAAEAFFNCCRCSGSRGTWLAVMLRGSANKKLQSALV